MEFYEKKYREIGMRGRSGEVGEVGGGGGVRMGLGLEGKWLE